MGRSLDSLDHWFDDLELGDRFEAPRGRTVTEADVVLFAGLSGDHYQLHTDAEFARTGPFGERVAHGMLTLALVSGLEYALFATGEKVLAFYGFDKVRMVAPVAFGDTIRLRGEIAGLDARDDERGVVLLREQVVNQRDEVVAYADKRLLYARRPAA
ncbi:MAG: MaoC/PaaZ C-terminal domain-containing protein [Thermoleophilia bacterium]